MIILVTVIRNDYTSRYYEFAIDSIEELDLLPTTQTAGKEYLSTIKSCCNGSFAYLSDSALTVWTLNGETDEWKIID